MTCPSPRISRFFKEPWFLLLENGIRNENLHAKCAWFFFLFFFFYKFIYLFLAALGLRCCARAFSSCGEQGLLFIAVRGLLILVASLVAEHGL